MVTDVSGRGVGMDVVKRNITSLGGTVEIESVAGVGMKVAVRLPLTLAIMDGMSVGVGEEVYILPLSSVVESFQVKADDVNTVANGTRLVKVRDEYMPVIALERTFKVPRADESQTSNIMVVVEAEGSRVALLVDEPAGPAPGGGEEPGKQLPQGAQCIGCHHFGRRIRGADSGYGRSGAPYPPLRQPTRTTQRADMNIINKTAEGVATGAREYLTFRLGEEEYGIDIPQGAGNPWLRAAHAHCQRTRVHQGRGQSARNHRAHRGHAPALQLLRGGVQRLHRGHHPEPAQSRGRNCGGLGQRCDGAWPPMPCVLRPISKAPSTAAASWAWARWASAC